MLPGANLTFSKEQKFLAEKQTTSRTSGNHRSDATITEIKGSARELSSRTGERNPMGTSTKGENGQKEKNPIIVPKRQKSS